MDKELKKCYHYMDLPYNSTLEEVQLRRNILIKIYNSKTSVNGKNYSKKIDKIELCTTKIIENINKFGVPTDKQPHFNASWESIVTQAIVLCFVAAICFASFYVLL